MSRSVLLPDRRKALLMLAGSLFDFVPGPTQGKSPVSSRRERGRPAPSRKDPCEVCDGDRVVRDKFGRELPCKACEGRGYNLVDPMMNVQPTRWSEPPASSFTRRALCDRCAGEGVWKNKRCEPCDGSGRVSVPIHRDMGQAGKESDGGSWWDRVIDLRDELGSYHRLEVALSELARRSLHRWRVFHAVHVVKTQSQGLLSGTEATLLEQAVRDLLGWMPEKIYVPAEVVAAERLGASRYKVAKGSKADPQAQALRDKAIQQRRRGGATIRDLMTEFDLGKSQVYEIVAEVEAA